MLILHCTRWHPNQKFISNMLANLPACTNNHAYVLSWCSDPHEMFWRTRSCSIPCGICPSFLLQDLRPPLQLEVIACTAHHPLILMLILYLKQSLGGRWRRRQQQNVGLSMFQLLFALPNICTKDVLSEAEPHRSVRSNRLAWVDDGWSSIENHIKCTFQFVNFWWMCCKFVKQKEVFMLWVSIWRLLLLEKFRSSHVYQMLGGFWYAHFHCCPRVALSSPLDMKSWSQSLFQRERFQASHIDLQERPLKLGNFEAFHFVPNPDAIDFSRFPNCLMFQFGYTCSGLEGYVPGTEGKRSNKEDTTKPRQNHTTRNSLWGQASQSLQEVGNRLESIRFEVEQLDSTPIFVQRSLVFFGICLAKPLSWRVHRTDSPPSPER